MTIVDVVTCPIPFSHSKARCGAVHPIRPGDDEPERDKFGLQNGSLGHQLQRVNRTFTEVFVGAASWRRTFRDRSWRREGNRTPAVFVISPADEMTVLHTIFFQCRLSPRSMARAMIPGITTRSNQIHNQRSGRPVKPDD